jgi:hypothetical protein
VIPDIKWRDPVSAGSIILDTNRFYLRPWVVRDRTLHWRDRVGRTWRARRDEGVKVADQGFDSEHIFSGVGVLYSDGTGAQQMVAPPGIQASTTAESLQSTDPRNPALSWGRTKVAIIDAGLTTLDGATRIGELFMAELAARRSAASTEVGNWQIFDEAGARAPSYEIREGDYLLIEDEPGAGERLVVAHNYNRASRTNSLDLDAPPDRLEAILERLQVVLVGVVGT